MYDKAKKENFALSAAKIKSNGDVNIKYHLDLPFEDEVHSMSADDTFDMEPDEDFTKLFRKLGPVVCRIFKLDSFRILAKADKFEAKEQQSRYLERHYQELLSHVEVRGVYIYNWETENRCVKITSVFTDDSNQKLPLNTGKIFIDQTVFGNESDIEDVIKSIIDEAYQYIFEGKRKQLEIPGFKAPISKKESVKKNTNKEELQEA